MLHITKDLRASALLKYCMMLITADSPLENIIPRIRMVRPSLIRWEKQSNGSITKHAPIHAARARLQVATKPVAPAPSTTRAAPKLAPELIPST